MQIEKRRRLYAYPELVYRQFGQEQHPQQMVIFDVKVINP